MPDGKYVRLDQMFQPAVIQKYFPMLWEKIQREARGHSSAPQTAKEREAAEKRLRQKFEEKIRKEEAEKREREAELQAEELKMQAEGGGR
jgi:hypothetical protein